MTTDRKKVTLKLDDVNACDRYVFNQAAAFEDQTRGQLISRLLREFAEQVFGEESVTAMRNEFEEQERRKQSIISNPKTLDSQLEP